MGPGATFRVEVRAPRILGSFARPGKAGVKAQEIFQRRVIMKVPTKPDRGLSGREPCSHHG